MKKLLLTWSALVIVAAVWAQDRTIAGKVTSAEDGSSLPGVNVIVKGTTNGAVTDVEGAYSLAGVPSGSTLIFSFIGLKTQEVNSGERTTVDVSMGLDVTQLTEVVVTGTGVATDKRKLGISVEAVSADKLPAAPSGSIDQALIGKIAGAQISSISGNPGDPTNILLRGINSVQGGTKPLIMVDGVQLAGTDINSLDLSNVERIEVVQGAASSSIYGAQGANGVIQIFTKKGKKGTLAINLSSSYAENTFLNTGDVHKSRMHGYITDAAGNLTDREGNLLQIDEYGSIDGISYVYGGTGASATLPNGNGKTRYAIQDIRNDFNKPYVGNLPYYDHFKQVFQKGYTTNNSVSISGGSEKSDFALSIANNHTLTAILKNGSLDRSNITANVGTELFKGFKVRSTTQLIYTENTMHPDLGGAGGRYYGKGTLLSDVSGTYNFLNTSPFFDLNRKLDDGTYPIYQTADFLSVNAGNPNYTVQYSNQLGKKVDLVQSFGATYVINKFFELDAKYGINYRTENSRNTWLNQTANVNAAYYDSWVGFFASNRTGGIINYDYKTTFQNFLGNAFFHTDFQEDFNINVPIQTSTQVGFDYRKRKYDELDVYGINLPIAPPINLNSTSQQNIDFDYTESFITYGYLVNQKIDFGDFGGVTAGFRSDWSSAFGGGSKPFTFPHYDGHILPSTFWKDNVISTVIPYFKLRAAYGEAGIQPNAFDRYPTLDQQPLGGGLVYNTPTTNKNPNLQVEVSKETEVGTDFTINAGQNGAWFNNINVAFTYWSRKSENVIYNVSLPPSAGSVDILTNAINMSSKGLQFSLNFPVYTSPNLKWDFTTNWGHQVSKIDAISGGNDIILNSGAGDASLVLTPGQVIGQIYGYKAIRSFDETRPDGTRFIQPGDEGDYTMVDGRVVKKSTYQIQFSDVKTPMANPNPKFNSSFINNINFKDFVTLNFQLDWVYGSKLYNQTKEWMYRDGIHGDYEKQVSIEGTDGVVRTGAFPAYWSSAYYGLFGSLSGAGNLATKDFFLEDASFLRLRNVSVAFDLAKVMKVSAIKKLQLVLTGRNLMTWTKYTGFDPEISSGGVNSAFDRGIDHDTLPNLKSYQVGLNVGF